MIGVIASLRVHQTQAAEFEAMFGELTRNVRANEPDNLVFQLCADLSEPNLYKVMEVYRDEQAHEAHRASAHFKAAGARLASMLAEPPQIDRLSALASE